MRDSERRKRSSTGVSPSNSTSNLTVPDFPKQRRASFGFLSLPQSPRANEPGPKENAESLQSFKKSNVRISHAASLQHLIFKDSENPEMPSGTLPRIKTQANTLSRLSRMLSPSKERLERLSDTLEAFNTTGIPLIFSQTVNPEKFHVKLKWLDLERSWEDIVENAEELSDHDKIQQSVIWELLYTEANYIRSMKAVVENHITALAHLQASKERLLADIDPEKLFSNFEEIYIANGHFWKNHFLKMLKSSRRTGRPLQIDYLYDGFIRISRLFASYTSFCIDTNSCWRYLQDKKESSTLFAKFMRWADQKIVSEHNKEGFKDHLSKPFQRITRYKLLLDRIKDQTADEAQRNKLNDMAASVGAFVQDVNDWVEARQKYEDLLELNRRLDYSIPPETPGEEFLRASEKFVTFNLLHAMPHNNNFREILYECPLRYKDAQMRWCDVYCFILTDMFLVTKRKKGDRYKVVRPPIKLDRIVLERSCDFSSQFTLALLDDFGFLRTIVAVMGQPKRVNEWEKKMEESKIALMQGACGINRLLLSESIVKEILPSPWISGPNAVFRSDSMVSSMRTLSITDQRRRFREPKGSDSTLPSNFTSPTACPSTSSLEGEKEEGGAEAEDEEEEEGDAEEGELTLMDSCSLHPCSRQPSRFLRTASPVQRKQQQHLRQQNCSPPADPNDSPLDDIFCDMAFRNRRGSRGDRRYRTADSLVPPRSHSIHKRLSLNYRGQGAEMPASSNLPPTSPTVPGLPATSVESFQSSSGFSSAGSAQHLHSGSELSEAGHEVRFEQPLDPNVGSPPSGGILANLPGRERAKKIISRHCMSLNDLTRIGLDPISDTNDNDEDSPEANSSSTSVRSVRKQVFVVHSSDGEGTDV